MSAAYAGAGNVSRPAASDTAAVSREERDGRSIITPGKGRGTDQNDERTETDPAPGSTQQPLLLTVTATAGHRPAGQR
ncbi:hypothetical protein KRM28CT15_29800 [Krasilnikovia sp. M28-CT-15]